jgi:hypothetical protein
MYCPSCGNKVSAALSYCNQCGVRLTAAEDKRMLPASSYNSLVGAAIGIPFVGLAMIFVLIAALKNGMGFRDDFIFGMIFLTFILLAITEIGCFVMLLTRSKAPKAPGSSAAKDDRELPGAALRGLGSPTYEPMQGGSVTDHTTRTLDPAYRPQSDLDKE